MTIKLPLVLFTTLIKHYRTKHIEVDRNFIKKKLQTRQICIPFVNIEDQLVDVFTKDLCSPGFNYIVGKLGMHNIYIPT